MKQPILWSEMAHFMSQNGLFRRLKWLILQAQKAFSVSCKTFYGLKSRNCCFSLMSDSCYFTIGFFSLSHFRIPPFMFITLYPASESCFAASALRLPLLQ